MKNYNKLERVLGILIVVPIYFFIASIFRIIGISVFDISSMITYILMFLPAFLGLILSCIFVAKDKKRVLSIILTIAAIINGLLAAYIFYQTYFVPQEGYNAIGYMFICGIFYVIFRLLSFIYCGLIHGWKKLGIYLLISIGIIIISIILIVLANTVNFNYFL